MHSLNGHLLETFWPHWTYVCRLNIDLSVFQMVKLSSWLLFGEYLSCIWVKASSTPEFFCFFCDHSTSQRGVAWVPRRTGRRSRKPLQPTERRGLSTARTATVLVSGPWSSTWPVSTCWRASKSQRPSSSLSLGFTQCCPQPKIFRRTRGVRTTQAPHLHAPTSASWNGGLAVAVRGSLHLLS